MNQNLFLLTCYLFHDNYFLSNYKRVRYSSGCLDSLCDRTLLRLGQTSLPRRVCSLSPGSGCPVWVTWSHLAARPYLHGDAPWCAYWPTVWGDSNFYHLSFWTNQIVEISFVSEIGRERVTRLRVDRDGFGGRRQEFDSRCRRCVSHRCRLTEVQVADIFVVFTYERCSSSLFLDESKWLVDSMRVSYPVVSHRHSLLFALPSSERSPIFS